MKDSDLISSLRRQRKLLGKLITEYRCFIEILISKRDNIKKLEQQLLSLPSVGRE